MQQQEEMLRKLAAEGDAQAMYQLGLLALRKEDVQQAFEWLHRAGERKHLRAIELLGVLILQGHGVKPDPALAFEYFRSAAVAGDAQALMRCAELMFNGKGVNQDRIGAVSCLVESAKQGYPIALRVIGFLLLRQSAIDEKLAVSAFRLAAYGGDPHAQYYMAKHGTSGTEANAWLALAATNGLYLARQQYSEGLDVADLAAIKGNLKAQLDAIIPTLNELTELTPFSYGGLKLESDVADIKTVENVFSVAESDYLINVAAAKLKPAKVVQADSTIELGEIRTGMTASLGQMLDVTVDWLMQRVADVIDIPLNRSETPSVIRYQPGEMYKQHGDYLPDDSILIAKDIGGQRSHTALVYLNESFTGGETNFNLLNKSVQPATGKLLTFSNINSDSKPLIESQHTGEAVNSGEKWLLSLWFRQFAPTTV